MRRAMGAQNRAAPSLERVTHRSRSERATRRPDIFLTSEVFDLRRICREKVFELLDCWRHQCSVRKRMAPSNDTGTK